MNNFVIDVDMGVDIDAIQEEIAKNGKGVCCDECGRSNVPLNNFEELGEGVVCSDCLKSFLENNF